MAKASRIPRTLDELLRALDHHQYLLRDALYGLREDPAHIKTLASELRTLVCLSSGTEGLLWRIADELGVSDVIELQCAHSVNRNHPLNQGLELMRLPLQRPGSEPPAPPAEQIRLRDVIKECEAIYVAQSTDRVFTHELLIGAIAGQMGGAHEAEGLDHSLIKLHSFLIHHQPLYVQVLSFDAELALQVGERVLDHAERHRNFRRARRAPDCGDVSLCVRVARTRDGLGPIPVLTFRSEISELEITFSASFDNGFFTFVKRGIQVAELPVLYPSNWGKGSDALLTLSYSSNERQARTIVNSQPSGPPVNCDIGWLDAREICPLLREEAQGVFAVRCIPVYCRLLSPVECGQLLELSADGRELRTSRLSASPFPD